MIIVTGGAGFLGSNLLAGLEARGYHDLVVCDRLGRDEKWRNVAKRELAYFIFPEDLFPFLDRHAPAVQAIFHMGAVSATTEADADLIVRSNIQLTLELWEWCARHHTRFLYASSAATYGDGSDGFDDDDSIAHLQRLRPLNAYGWSKHMVDRRIARLVHQAKDWPRPPQWAGLKFFNVYGPNEYHKGGQKSVVAHLYPKVKAGEPARLFKSYRSDFADGGQLRDFVWVDDCTEVMLWLLDNPQVNGLFNIGTGQARSFDDLAKAVFKALEMEPKIEYFDMPESLRPKYQYFTEASMDKLRQNGFDRPFVSLEEGIERYVRDYLDTADPYR